MTSLIFMPTRDELGIGLILFLPVLVLVGLMWWNGGITRWSYVEDKLAMIYGDRKRAKRDVRWMMLIALILFAGIELLCWGSH